MTALVTRGDAGTARRTAAGIIGVVGVVLALAGCGSGGSPERSPDDLNSAVAVAASFDHAAMALPTDDQLPQGFSVSYRCPGGDGCRPTDGHDAASVFADAEAPPEVEEAEFWHHGWFSLAVEYHPDEAAATAARDAARDDLAPTTTAEFAIEPESFEEGGFRPGREGSGELADHEIAGWAGVEGSWTAVLISDEGDRSAERQAARLVVTHDRVVVRCSSHRYAAEGEGLARSDCREAVAGYLARLGKADPAEAPRVVTAARLAAALPGEDQLPAGHEVSVRCPGDSPCTDEDQSQDASVSVYLPLPEGVPARGDSGIDRFRVSGGEWSERLRLRAWLHSDEGAARTSFEERTSGYGDLVGKLDTAPEETDTGYDYGIRGRGEVVELEGAGWTGRVKVYDARFVHLDGRITERRYDITGVAHRGTVLLTVDSSFTVEGRAQADVVDLVRAHVSGFFDRLTPSG